MKEPLETRLVWGRRDLDLSECAVVAISPSHRNSQSLPPKLATLAEAESGIQMGGDLITKDEKSNQSTRT